MLKKPLILAWGILLLLSYSCSHPNEADVYTVTYNGNGNTGGSVPTDNNDYEEGQTVTVSGNTGNLEKTGYAFAGWNRQADGTGTNYGAGSTFTMGSSNVTLYAKWSDSGDVDVDIE